MRILAPLVWFIAIAGISLTANAADGPPPPAGKSVLLIVEGRVEIARSGSLQWTPGQANQELTVGDRVRTGFKSRATMRLSDLSVLRLNQLTTLEIKPPRGAGQNPAIDLKAGATYFFNRENPGTTTFQTPVASGAVRGTEFHLAVAEDGRTEVALLDGEVSLAGDGGEISLKGGEQGSVEKGQAPKKTALLDAVNIIQWTLYYPAVIDVDELRFSAAEQKELEAAISAYRQGDLLSALSAYPQNRAAGSAAEKTFYAGLLLSVGRVDDSTAILKVISESSPQNDALKLVISAVKNQSVALDTRANSASELIARSYYLQARLNLSGALSAACEAATKSPRFGAAHVRVAELEFGFGRVKEAAAALKKGLDLSPKNAEALALQGFLLTAHHKYADALGFFDRAIAADGALGNAWLGRGLVKIHQGNREGGRADLQVAAALEPQRAILRSYLGKAFSHADDPARAKKELGLAKKLDPQDPTAWLYSALLNQRQGAVNDAIRDLEKSQQLNDNRGLYRSRLLLDQDQAVRSANLATIYKDAGMTDLSVREASRGVNFDYASYTSHLFLANSYEALRDPKRINLRYEAPHVSEFLVSQLLAPPNSGTLSPTVSQQEYSRMFDKDRLGVFSKTEYLSSGEWIQQGSQFGYLGNFGYALDAYYHTDPGQRPNNDLEQLELAVSLKQQLTSQDSVYLEVGYSDLKSGDVAQYYDQSMASLDARAQEKQNPNIIAGYHHEWQPGVHTLILASRFNDRFDLAAPSARLLWLRSGFGGVINSAPNPIASLALRRNFDAYSVELEQIWQTKAHTVVFGGRYQAASPRTETDIDLVTKTLNQNFKTDLDRISFYAYDYWQVCQPLQVIAGVSYDRLHFPRNIDIAPITSEEANKEKVSPKIGFTLTPCRDTHVRGIYTRSLGGVFFDASVRLEPTQIAGFNQSFRSLIPESVVGLVPGTSFETGGVGLDHSFRETGTYVSVDGEILRSKADRTVGVLNNSFFFAGPDTASMTPQSLNYEEKSLLVTLNQLVGRELSFGARYKLTHADLDSQFTQVPVGVANAAGLNQAVAATLHQLNLYALFNHSSGFFSGFNSVWSIQSNHGYLTDQPGSDFWQHNVFAGYRFLQRRAEVQVGLLNIFDRNYRLNPLSLYSELPRERTFATSLKLYF